MPLFFQLVNISTINIVHIPHQVLVFTFPNLFQSPSWSLIAKCLQISRNSSHPQLSYKLLQDHESTNDIKYQTLPVLLHQTSHTFLHNSSRLLKNNCLLSLLQKQFILLDQNPSSSSIKSSHAMPSIWQAMPMSVLEHSPLRHAKGYPNLKIIYK